MQPLASFVTNPASAAIVNGHWANPQIVQSTVPSAKQYLVILPGTPEKPRSTGPGAGRELLGDIAAIDVPNRRDRENPLRSMPRRA